MKDKKLAIWIVVVYMIIMYIGTSLSNYILGSNFSSIKMLTSFLMVQVISAIFIIYVVRKNYGWKKVGFDNIETKNLIWFVPYGIMLLSMIFTFIKNIYINCELFNEHTWVTLSIILVGTLAVGFSEEVMFRGIVLNSFKSESSILKGMILGSIGFSIIHIVNIFIGASLIEVIIQIVSTSLLGFAFVSLAIKLNNIWPIIIFHSIWNFIIISSPIIGAKVPVVTVFCNPINFVIGIILWSAVIKEEKSRYIY